MLPVESLFYTLPLSICLAIPMIQYALLTMGKDEAEFSTYARHANIKALWH